MKVILFTALTLATAGAIYYMYYDATHPIKFTPTGDFSKDDETLYNLIRSDYKAFRAPDLLTEFDTMARQNFESGNSTVDGHVSKTAAYLDVIKTQDSNSPKNKYYNSLLSNLTKRYA